MDKTRIDLQNKVLEANEVNARLENTLKQLNSTNPPESREKQLVELSKENAILDHKLLKMTRMYTNVNADF